MGVPRARPSGSGAPTQKGCGVSGGFQGGGAAGALQAMRGGEAVKDFTLYQIEKMLDDGDFSLASRAQLKEAAKLIKEQARLMERL
jgi:hypothetical protein